ncbi:MAG: hypothetical protein ACRCYU_13890 [Nocardioides sp.]
MGAAHKPGAIALRPLGLGDFYDGALTIIRVNPAATVGVSVIVTAVAMLIPVFIAAVVTAVYGDISPASSTSTRFLSPEPAGPTSTEAVAGQLIAAAGTLIGALVQVLGLTLVTGMIAQVVAAGVLGKRLSMTEAWSATRGTRWRLIGLSFGIGTFLVIIVGGWVAALVWLWFATESVPAVVVVGLLSGLVMMVLLTWLWIRLSYLAVPPLMLERGGIGRALGRSYRLTGGHFWRTFGIAMLTLVLTSVASGILTFPLSMVAVAIAVSSDGTISLMTNAVIQAVSTIISSAFVTPFSAAVACLQYVDLRMRKEAFDLHLVAVTHAQDSVVGRP